MTILDDFARVDREHPCPVCEKRDWCLISRDNLDSPARVVCARVESRHRFGEAGWLHVLHDDGSATSRRSRRRVRHVRRQPEALPCMEVRAARFQDAVNPANLVRLAIDLNLEPRSLRRLGIGWTGRSWSFPMRDNTATVCGIRLRRPDGTKLSISGSRDGMFVPRGLLRYSRLLICEGPTDTAAMLDLGFETIGRPSCASGARLIEQFVRGTEPEEVIVVADNGVPGRRGAESLAARLLPVGSAVRVIAPPPDINDAREWKTRGVTRQELEEVIRDAPKRRMTVTALRRKGGRS